MPCAISLVLECKSAYIFFLFSVNSDFVIPAVRLVRVRESGQTERSVPPESKVRFNTLEGQPRGFPPARPTWNGMTQRLCTNFR